MEKDHSNNEEYVTSFQRIIYVTEIQPDGQGDYTQKIIKRHYTSDLRRIVRQYAKAYDCEVREGIYQYTLKPRNGAAWRVQIGFV
jgi:hypothetical protein